MGLPVTGSLSSSATMGPVNRTALHPNKGERLGNVIMTGMVVMPKSVDGL